MWLPPELESDRRSDLGATLIGGAVVAFSIRSWSISTRVVKKKGTFSYSLALHKTSGE